MIQITIIESELNVCITNYLFVRGRPFDPEGEAWQIWSGQIIYFHHGLGRKNWWGVFSAMGE